MRKRSEINIWRDIPDKDWDNWKWQLKNKVKDVETLSEIINLNKKKRYEISEILQKMRMEISPYFSLLLDPDDEECPVRKQVIPDIRELQVFDWEVENIQCEDHVMTDFGVSHLYPDRVAFFSSHSCSSLCRYCFRKWALIENDVKFKPEINIDKMLMWLKQHREVRDVLITGGDPLTLSDSKIDYMLTKLLEIETVEIVRLGTRFPVFLPQRITENLLKILKKHRPLYINIQVNHPNELTPLSKKAINSLADTGAVLGNQTVLLKGINDNVAIQKKLNQELLKVRCRPYYLFQADQVRGMNYLRTPISKGLEIMEGLHGWTSGLAIPHYVIGAAPGGGEKIPLNQQTFTKIPGASKIKMKTYKNDIRWYVEPSE